MFGFRAIAEHIAANDYFLNPVCENATVAFVTYVESGSRLVWSVYAALGQAMVAACF